MILQSSVYTVDHACEAAFGVSSSPFPQTVYVSLSLALSLSLSLSLFWYIGKREFNYLWIITTTSCLSFVLIALERWEFPAVLCPFLHACLFLVFSSSLPLSLSLSRFSASPLYPSHPSRRLFTVLNVYEYIETHESERGWGRAFAINGVGQCSTSIVDRHITAWITSFYSSKPPIYALSLDEYSI